MIERQTSRLSFAQCFFEDNSMRCIGEAAADAPTLWVPRGDIDWRLSEACWEGAENFIADTPESDSNALKSSEIFCTSGAAWRRTPLPKLGVRTLIRPVLLPAVKNWSSQ